MKTIAQLIQQVPDVSVVGNAQVTVLHLTYDSRHVGEGSLFFAIKGTQVDGHQFIDAVVEKGAAAIVCEILPEHINSTVTYIQVKDSTAAMGLMAAEFYDHPSKKLKVTAITGTNGKTTVATLLFRLFRSFGHNVGLLSTVQNQINETVIPSTHTTPDSIRINELLEHMVEQGCEYAFMEASSHAIHQNRIKGLHFAGVVFSNITHDHLDYHETFANYIAAKKKLFDEVNDDAFALTNKDDKNGMVIAVVDLLNPLSACRSIFFKYRVCCKAVIRCIIFFEHTTHCCNPYFIIFCNADRSSIKILALNVRVFFAGGKINADQLPCQYKPQVVIIVCFYISYFSACFYFSKIFYTVVIPV